MIQLLIKAVHPLFGRITVRFLWKHKPHSKFVAGAGVHITSSPLSALYSHSPFAASDSRPPTLGGFLSNPFRTRIGAKCQLSPGPF